VLRGTGGAEERRLASLDAVCEPNGDGSKGSICDYHQSFKQEQIPMFCDSHPSPSGHVALVRSAHAGSVPAQRIGRSTKPQPGTMP
jgi:hypothetical protein